MLLNAEGVMDESILMLENSTQREGEANLDESSTMETKEISKTCDEMVVRQDVLFSCDGCDLDFEYQDDLNDHKSNIHAKSNCLCSFKPGENTILKNHSNDCSAKNNTEITGREDEDIQDTLSPILDEKKDNLKETVVICGICALGFESITDCDKHIETHKKILLCPSCSTLFCNKEELEEHSKSKHQNQTRDKMFIEEYQLICENCGRTFDTSEALSKHTESEHGSDDQTKCNQ